MASGCDQCTLRQAPRTAFRVRQALTAYSNGRRRHLDFYQFMTRFLTPFFQGDSNLLTLIRNLTFPHSRWFGPLRREMTRTMVGVGRGFVRRPIPLADLPRLKLRQLKLVSATCGDDPEGVL